MFGTPVGCYIDQDGMNFINAVRLSLLSQPQFEDYTITINALPSVGAVELSLSQFNRLENKFVFYGLFGKLNSIAIYGNNLYQHYSSINRRGSIFGIPVIQIDNEGDFIDVTLDRNINLKTLY